MLFFLLLTSNALLAALKCKTLYRYQLNLLCNDLEQKQHLYTDINYVFSVSFAQTFKDALNGKCRCCIKLFSWEFTDGGKRFFVSEWMSTRLVLFVQLSNIAATDDFPWVQRKTTTVLWEKRQEIGVKETESERVTWTQAKYCEIKQSDLYVSMHTNRNHLMHFAGF